MAKAKTSSYKIINVVNGRNGKVKADLTENGVVVAKVTRDAMSKSFVYPYQAKFLSDASKARFCSYCNCLTIDETIEAIFPK